MSPSTIRPSSFPCQSTTQAAPRRLAEIDAGRLGHRGVRQHGRQIFARPHQVTHFDHVAPEQPGRMLAQEILLGEAARPAGRHGKAVADRHLQDRARGRRHPDMVGLARDPAADEMVRGSGERRFRPPDDPDQPTFARLQHGQDAQDFFGRAAVREDDHQIAGLDRAEIAMRGLGGVEKEGRRSKAGEGRRDLGRDQARLADAEADDRPFLPGNFGNDRAHVIAAARQGSARSPPAPRAGRRGTSRPHWERSPQSGTILRAARLIGKAPDRNWRSA